MCDALTYPFMQRALAAGVLVGVTTSLLGVLVVLRRSAFFGDAIAHAASYSRFLLLLLLLGAGFIYCTHLLTA